MAGVGRGGNCAGVAEGIVRKGYGGSGRGRRRNKKRVRGAGLGTRQFLDESEVPSPSLGSQRVRQVATFALAVGGLAGCGVEGV